MGLRIRFQLKFLMTKSVVNTTDLQIGVQELLLLQTIYVEGPLRTT